MATDTLFTCYLSRLVLAQSFGVIQYVVLRIRQLGGCLSLVPLGVPVRGWEEVRGRHFQWGLGLLTVHPGLVLAGLCIGVSLSCNVKRLQVIRNESGVQI